MFTSILAFNIIQFFPLLNYQLLSLILLKASFDPKVSLFFQDYLVDRKTRYFWNNLSSSFKVNVEVAQGSAFSPVLSALYLSLLLYIFEKQLKNLKIPVSILSFVDNNLFIAQNKSLMVSNSNLLYSYCIITSFLEKFGLIIECRKIFHFSKLHSIFDPPPLDLKILGGPIL